MDLVWRTAYLLLRERWGFDKESPRQWRPAISVDDETVVEGRKVKSAKGMFDGVGSALHKPCSRVNRLRECHAGVMHVMLCSLTSTLARGATK